MAQDNTVIVVGVTRTDTYGNLWVTPKGGGDEVKIGSKRSQLHELFEQDKAIMLHWETYKGKAYVSDAKLVEGELPAPQPQGKALPVSRKVNNGANNDGIAPQERGMWYKELGEMLRAGDIDKTTPMGKVWRSAYYTEMSRVLGISVKEVPAKSKLLDEAKKLGGEEKV